MWFVRSVLNGAKALSDLFSNIISKGKSLMMVLHSMNSIRQLSGNSGILTIVI